MNAICLVFVIICSGSLADPVRPEATWQTDFTDDANLSSRAALSATQRFLQLMTGNSGYDGNNDQAARSLFYSGTPARKEGVRLAGIPILLLPVEVPSSNWQGASQLASIQGFRPSNVFYAQSQNTKGEVPQSSSYGASTQDFRPSNEVNPQLQYTKRPQRPAYKEPSGPSFVQSVESSDTPKIESSEPSSQLLEKFRAQTPNSAGEPPIIQSEFDSSERIIFSDDEDDGEEQEREQAGAPVGVRKARAVLVNVRGKGDEITPARPRFTKPLKLQGILTVPRAGYSESYTAWWDPSKGDSRIHFQGGSTVTFRKMLPNGLVDKVEMHVDRSKERVVRCGVTSAVASESDRANPALPDIQLFKYSGSERTENGLVESWEHDVSTNKANETVTTHHELLLIRELEGFIRPIRYRVTVNSSVLGPDSDTYEHIYLDARPHNRGSEFFNPNIDEVCSEVERLNASSAEHIARLEPLREFTMSEPDPRYGPLLEQYKKKYNRQYSNNVEETIRKNLMMQSSRFISSGNRAGATVELGVNFLADRLDVEIDGITGVKRDADGDRAEKFPYSQPSLPVHQNRLPDEFDWRTLGGVTPVRFQGLTCASCWAFAVTGAVEGALFRRTRRLIPLSEQSLVDCARPYGAKGCKGTWPSHAYDYVKNRGLPALEEYTPYEAKELQCKADTTPSVTLISAHVNVTKYSVPAVQVAIKNNGPVVVIIDSKTKSFLYYKKGVLYDDRCSKKSARHATLAVGWGQTKGEPHLILKNSWSEKWGDKGYIRVHARSNTCGVLTYPSYPRLEDNDVLIKTN